MLLNKDSIIHVWTDGGCEKNPGGKCGIGIVLIYNKHKKEISEFIGKGTNNIAELTAIKRSMEQIKKREIPLRIYTDSSYCIGVLQSGWKAKANKEIIVEIKKLMKGFKDLKLIKVSGHKNTIYNNRADELARNAITQYRETR